MSIFPEKTQTSQGFRTVYSQTVSSVGPSSGVVVQEATALPVEEPDDGEHLPLVAPVDTSAPDLRKTSFLLVWLNWMLSGSRSKLLPCRTLVHWGNEWFIGKLRERYQLDADALPDVSSFDTPEDHLWSVAVSCVLAPICHDSFSALPKMERTPNALLFHTLNHLALWWGRLLGTPASFVLALYQTHRGTTGLTGPKGSSLRTQGTMLLELMGKHPNVPKDLVALPPGELPSESSLLWRTFRLAEERLGVPQLVHPMTELAGRRVFSRALLLWLGLVHAAFKRPPPFPRPVGGLPKFLNPAPEAPAHAAEADGPATDPAPKGATPDDAETVSELLDACLAPGALDMLVLRDEEVLRKGVLEARCTLGKIRTQQQQLDEDLSASTTRLGIIDAQQRSFNDALTVARTELARDQARLRPVADLEHQAMGEELSLQQSLAEQRQLIRTYTDQLQADQELLRMLSAPRK